MTLEEVIYALRRYSSPTIDGNLVVVTLDRKEGEKIKVIHLPLCEVLEAAANELEKRDTEALKFRYLRDGMKKYSPDLYRHIMGEEP